MKPNMNVFTYIGVALVAVLAFGVNQGEAQSSAASQDLINNKTLNKLNGIKEAAMNLTTIITQEMKKGAQDIPTYIKNVRERINSETQMRVSNDVEMFAIRFMEILDKIANMDTKEIARLINEFFNSTLKEFKAQLQNLVDKIL